MTRLEDYCTTCNHPIHDHGDRAIGGHCDHGLYPNTACNCTGYTEGGATSGTPLGAA
jgi:hypothetical protein